MRSIREDIAEVLLSETQIQQRLDQLAAQIEQDYADKELTLIPVLTGSAMFIADLLRRLSLPLRLDYLGVSSYHGQTQSSGTLLLTKDLQLDVRGHDVLIVEDVLDSGLTLARINELVGQLEPRSLKTCVLLEKDVPHHQGIHPDYVGFRIPNRFIVGYGLDYRERYRNLPYIGVLKADVLGASAAVPPET